MKKFARQMVISAKSNNNDYTSSNQRQRLGQMKACVDICCTIVNRNDATGEQPLLAKCFKTKGNTTLLEAIQVSCRKSIKSQDATEVRLAIKNMYDSLFTLDNNVRLFMEENRG